MFFISIDDLLTGPAGWCGLPHPTSGIQSDGRVAPVALQRYLTDSACGTW